MKFLLLLFLASLSTYADTYYLTVAGLGGDSEYETLFAKWAADLDRGLKRNGPQAHVETISGPAATRSQLSQVFSRLAQQAAPGDAFALFLIGHGTFDGAGYKFNVPGPDVSAATLREWLNGIKATRQLVVDMTSCSGAALASLAAPDRIVITATKSGTEKNAPVFARFFIEALSDEAADTDKNGVITALEAFRYSKQKVAAYFDTEKLIASEHSQFTDNGTSNAVREAGPNHQGALASAFPLLHTESDVAPVASTPAKRKLLAHKDELEAKIDRLKYRKTSLEEADYKQQLAGLLLDLARTQAELDK